jgi:hypothetical protein
MTDRIAFVSLLLLTGGNVLLACDNSARNEQIAAVEKKPEELDDKAAQDRKEKRLAAEKAKADAAESIRTEIAKIAVVGPKPPKTLAEACEGAADAQDRFIARLQSAEAQTKWTADRERQRPMAIIECTSAESLDVAGCQINALDTAPPALADHMNEILEFCVSKFARPKATNVAPSGSGVIPKRPK